MKNDVWTILFLLGIIIGFLIAFPSYTKDFFDNKLSILFSSIVIICILFLVWLKVKTDD